MYLFQSCPGSKWASNSAALGAACKFAISLAAVSASFLYATSNHCSDIGRREDASLCASALLVENPKRMSSGSELDSRMEGLLQTKRTYNCCIAEAAPGVPKRQVFAATADLPGQPFAP
eukprot:8047624-Pyramimonas_sp.AAC.1